MNKDIEAYNSSLENQDREVCEKLMQIIDQNLSFTEKKLWHGHPVWFIDGNPIVGYSKQKGCVRLMFWSGADFEEVELVVGTGKFKDASKRYTGEDQINEEDIKRWLSKAEKI